MRKGTCIHASTIGLEHKCDLGLNPEAMAKSSCNPGEDYQDGLVFRLPCQTAELLRSFRRAPDKLSDGQEHCLSQQAKCDKYQDPTPEQIAKHEEEMRRLIDGLRIARKAILADLSARHKNGDKSVQLNKSCNPEVESELSNFVSGRGQIDCLVCKVGKLSYRRPSYNGHIHAACSTEDCVRWME